MLYWAVVFLVIAIVAGVLGFGGVAGAATGIAKILFFIFLILLVLTLVANIFGGQGRLAWVLIYICRGLILILGFKSEVQVLIRMTYLTLPRRFA